MENREETAILAIDEDMAPCISISEAQALQPIQKKFIESYLEHRECMPIDEWLRSEMSLSLPECSAQEIKQMSDEIITTLRVQEEKGASLKKAIANGRRKESWFADEAKAATSYMSVQKTAQYLQDLDDALTNANESLYRTIHTQAGAISQNPHLDGFIAEQYHAQTFNLNAEITGSPYRAKVLEPTGNGYAKNSVDIAIVDERGKVVRRYQSKYCKDAEATAQAFEHGNYRGQQKLVPDGQEQSILKKATTVIQAPDGTTSKPLSKERAKELQREAQTGKWNDLNWNEYRTKDIAIGIGKQAGQAAVMGAAIGVGFDVAKRAWNGEEIRGEELVETAIISGADFGIKAAVAGALKVGAEKSVIAVIPKGTPAGTIANIVHIAVENVKIAGKIAIGELTAKEGVEKIEQTTVATIAGIACCTKGAAIGTQIGTVLGPIGSLAGAFIGGSVGYMAGSKVGEMVIKGMQKIRGKVWDTFQSAGNTISNMTDFVSNSIRGFCCDISSLFW